MRPLALLLLCLPVFGVAQARKVLITGTLRTAPSGTRFALGSRLGTMSVEAKGATVTLGGKEVRLTDLRLGTGVAIFGTLAPGTATVRPLLGAARIEAVVPGTAPRRRTLKRA